jgi:hypothetical protein
LGWADLDQKQHDQISVLAAYTQPIGDQTTALLRQANYTPPVSSEEWKRYPALRKLEFAYRAAEKARPGQGKDLLAFVAQSLADLTLAPADDLQLKSLLALDVDPSIFEFARGPPLDDWPILPIELREQTRTIAKYASRSIVGSTYDVLVTILKLDSDQAYEILVNSSSHEEGLERGFASEVLQLCSHSVIGWPDAHPGPFGLRSIQMAAI